MSWKRILVPTDFSKAADRATEQAALLAERLGARVRLWHRIEYPRPVMPPPSVEADVLERILHESWEGPRREAEQAMEERRVRLETRDFDLETTVEETAAPLERLLELATEWKPDLLCLGTHGREGFEKLLMGSFAEKLLRHHEGQLLIVRADARLARLDEKRPILVPVDFSEYSQRAVGVARELAAVSGGRLHLLHVVPLVHTPFKPGGLSSPLETEAGLRNKLQAALDSMLDGAAGDAEVCDGDIAGEILARRDVLDAGLVLLGCRGMSGLKHYLIGSVTEKIARFSEVPVWVIK